jgi:hypothetical protein
MLVFGCSQMKFLLPSGESMVELTKVSGVQVTDAKMIDGDLSTAATMSHPRVDNLPSTPILGIHGAKHVEAIISWSNPQYISKIKIYSINLGKGMVFIFDPPGWNLIGPIKLRKQSSGVWVGEIFVGKRNVQKIKICSPLKSEDITAFQVQLPKSRHVIVLPVINEIEIWGY